MNSSVKRLLYMLVAIIATIPMHFYPDLNFQSDKGIIYMRSYEMDQTHFRVIQTKLDNSETEVVATMSIVWLKRAKWAILGATILCLLCFFNNQWRIIISLLTIVLCCTYYIVLISYSMRISDAEFPTIYPTLITVLPAIVVQMMILLRKNILEDVRHRDETMEND